VEIDFYQKNILIVDDDKSNIFLLDALLEDLGYSSILSASSAKEAYELLEKHHIDLMLLDIIMPEITGLEATKSIRSNEHYDNIPIIMVTADDSDKTIDESFKLGANDFITKPLNRTNLKVRVHSALMGAYKDALISNQNRLLAVNETVQMLAHQWRQPLALISSTVIEISMSYEFEKLTPEKLDEAIFKINDSVHTLSATLDEFSKISKNESQASFLLLNHTVTSSINLIKDRMQANKIELISEFHDTQKIRYFHNELITVILAIVTNSIEAFVRSNIQESRYIKILTTQTANTTCITIEDNAGGVDASILPKVFEPYISTKEQKNGVGLGLYNAFHTLRKSMKASIALHSKADTTLVEIELPNL